MNILFFVSNLSYPPIEGAHARTLELINVLASRGHSVTLAGFVKRSSPFDLTLYKKNHQNIIVGDFREYSGSYISQALRNIASRIEFTLFDVVHFEGFAVISCGSRCKTPKILSLIDPWALRQKRKSEAENNKIKKIIYRFGAILSELLERRYLKAYSSVHVVSPVDAIALKNSHSLSNVVHIPVSFDQRNMFPQKVDYSTDSKLKIVFWADLNVAYLLESLRWYISNVHQVISKNIDVELYILGRASKGFILENVPSLSNSLNVNVIEWTDDLNLFLSTMDIAVLPDLSGTGLKNRTLHAMALGLPTLGSQYAFEGINIGDTSFRAICTTSQDYLDNIMALSRSIENRLDLASQLKAAISNNYDATVIAMEWEDLYRMTIEKNNIDASRL